MLNTDRIELDYKLLFVVTYERHEDTVTEISYHRNIIIVIVAVVVLEETININIDKNSPK